jgi:hypothetical protein
MRCPHSFTITVLIALLGLLQLPVQAKDKYHSVLITNPTESVLRTMAELGLPMDDARMIKDQGLDIPLSETEITLLQGQSISYRIIRRDLEKYYGEICRENMLNLPLYADTDPVHMKYGSMGGFYTWEQILADLDSMNLLYPNLCAVKVSLGQGWNANPLYMVKISDNVGVNEAEPEVEIDGTIHAREPGAYTTVLYTMWWLLENYGTDPEATYLVNNREFYFIPVVNPDGFRYNQQTNPGGGGMWRKNRRFNNPSYGVDCNRNFTYQWGYDNQGSSPTPSAETYRGPSAGSEPETQAMMNFLNANECKTSLSLHSYSGCYLCPYGYANVLPPQPDYDIFLEYLSVCAAPAGYSFGTIYSIMYAVNGGSKDWVYHDANVFALGVEVGTHDFWPSVQYIMPDAAANLTGLLYTGWTAGAVVEGTELAVADGYLTPGQNENLTATVMNKGLGVSEAITYELTTTDPYITVTPNIVSVAPLASRATSNNASNPFVVQVASNCPLGYSATLSLVVHQGGFNRSTPFAFVVGTPTSYFSDNGENGTANWTISQYWGLTTTTSHSPTHSFADSPAGNYSNNVTCYMTLTQNLNLTNITAPWLDFWTKWSIEPDYDFGQVEVSINNGASWMAISGLYTVPGSGIGVQPAGQHGYDGSQMNWVHEHMSLAAYAGQATVKFRFKFRTDGGLVMDGWYVDDIQVLGFPTVATPSLDVTLEPINPPIVVPANGGSFQFNASVVRTVGPQASFSAWARMKYPDGTYTGPTLGPVTINPPVGVTLTRLRSQNIPSSYPAGLYTYLGYANLTYTYPAIDSSSFTFTKSAVAGEGPMVWDATCSGEPFPGEMMNSFPEAFGLLGAYPNPFNPSTIIRYQLPETDYVSLKVFDSTGRLVAMLTDAVQDAGSHEVTFGASGLASGLYFARMQTGGLTTISKMMLLK